jgi:threonine aldolase
MIDLRSDTVTRPTASMLAAMTRAETGDDVFDEDPTVHALEERVAAMLGQEAALFTVSGSLANGLGVRALVPPGWELLCEEQAHIVRAEHGAHAIWHGVTTRTWPHPRGWVDLAAVNRLMVPDAGPFIVSTAAIAVENTHNFAGGTVHPLADLVQLRQLANDAGIRLHLDGARLWNAYAASGVPLREYGRLFDTVAVCLSKGLGAPIGSLLAGPADVVGEARVWRKRLGAGWRQAGVLAAAGIYALDHHVERLADDHAHAYALADVVAQADPSVVDPSRVETNVVLLNVGERAQSVVDQAQAEGVLVVLIRPGLIRLVTHLDVSAEDVQRAGKVLARIISR